MLPFGTMTSSRETKDVKISIENLHIAVIEAACFIISVDSVCLSVCLFVWMSVRRFSKALTYEVHCTSGISAENTGKVRI